MGSEKLELELKLIIGAATVRKYLSDSRALLTSRGYFYKNYPTDVKVNCKTVCNRFVHCLYNKSQIILR